MTQTCDICLKPIEPGQPRFGGHGAGDRTGAQIGSGRHYACHVERYGRPCSTSSTELFGNLRRAIRDVDTPPARVIKEPKVRSGELNRSENAARPFKLYGIISEMGRRRGSVDCPFCGTTFTAYVWSLSGGGKKCPRCGAMHASSGIAYPIVGNEDL